MGLLNHPFYAWQSYPPTLPTTLLLYQTRSPSASKCSAEIMQKLTFPDTFMRQKAVYYRILQQ
jgi:hypothetical protein